ncbi:MAG: hypothetical protein E5X69_06390, partial [Mesorhizobium sp.]
MDRDLRRLGAGIDQGLTEERIHRQLENPFLENGPVAAECVIVHRPADIGAVEYGHQGRGNAAPLHDASDAQAV